MRRFLAVLLVAVLPSAVLADGWHTYRGDAGRTGFTSQALPTNLALHWQYRSPHVPQPAWPRDPRMEFDRAFHPVVANGTLYFGDSVDGTIRALDAATGRLKWTFYTEGPVRFAPAVWKDRLFAVSDDGHLYCVSAGDGKLLWKKRGGPNDDRVLGNGRITSRWPARGGAVVKDGVVYFAAGIWQSEKVYLYALDPASGKTLWVNDSSGGLFMAQPHGGAYSASGVSAQGYLVADDDKIYVPTGRAVPAVFNRKDGKFLFYHLQANGHRGGTATAVVGRFIYNGGAAFLTENGVLRSRLGNGPVAAFAGGILHHNGSRLAALKQVRRKTRDRKGKEITVDDHATLWRIDRVPGGTSLIVAGNTAVSGAAKKVALIDLKTQKAVATLPVDGVPHGLAVADGKLYVGTDTGSLYCFGPADAEKPRVNAPVARKESDAGSPALQAAKAIIAQSKITDGYCVDLGCGDGALSMRLAERTNLHIIAVDPDPSNVAKARQRFEAAGLYGSRVMVLQADPAKTHLPKFIANLVVSGRAVTERVDAEVLKEAARMQRPWGGVVCIGKPKLVKAVVRGPLKNAGDWSHLYSNAANTLSSNDDVKGPLSVLWYRDVDLELPQRHGRGPSPLFHNGRLFAEGMNELRAVDAYNGRTLWKFPLKGVLEAYDADHIVGTSQTGSNFCAAGDSVYVRYGGDCYRLDAATGKQLGKFATPKRKDDKPPRWGYIACEGGVLFGSIVNEDHIVRHAWLRADKQMKQLFTESQTLFALDANTGKLLWRYDAKDSIRHNAIAIGDGRVFLIDRPLAQGDRLDRVAKRRGKNSKRKATSQPTGKLVVLDAKTGKQKWTNAKDIFGTMLAFSERNDMLLMSYQSTRFKLPSEVGGRMAVFRATEGYRVWDKKVNYITRPLINGRTIITQNGALDLLTGDEKPFKMKRYYGCGQISSSKNLLLFRSGTLAYKDLSRKAGTESFGGIRPGCWINSLPAGGLVFIPDASAGCQCSYQNRAWVALQGR
jgi:outer membrane protein assembly factor BamB